jgi:hypothetical protein
VVTPKFTDYVLVAFDDAEHQLTTPDGQAFSFAEHGYIRVAEGRISACGKLKGFRLIAGEVGPGLKAQIGSSEVALRSAGGFLEWGQLTKQGALATRPEKLPQENADEGKAAVHLQFSPEEVHLAVGEQRAVSVKVRAVGTGQVQGRISLQVPKGLEVQPAEFTIEPLTEGTARTVSLQLRAAKDAPAALHRVGFIPEAGLRGAPAELLASVGVVISEDHTIPMESQYVVRAPGYMMKVNHMSGVSFYLLDRDGHRRHGRMRGTNFTTGIGALEQDGHWACHFSMPCQFIWAGADNLTVGCGSLSGDTSARLRYTFHEDRIVLGLIPPTNPTKQQTLWLGNFDVLQQPRHNGKQAASHLPIVGDRFFFPHPVYRQGVLLRTPPETSVKYLGTAVNMPLRVGQEVILQFIEESEAVVK